MKKYICKFSGCNKSSFWKNDGKKGWCSVHYRRWQRHGNPSICKYAPDGSGCISKGYRIITVNGKRIFEHRYIMEQFLKRKLDRKEILHHKNKNPLDNRIENLEIMTQNEHAKIHAPKPNKPKIRCAHCNKIFKTTAFQIKRNIFNFCCRKHASKERRENGKNHIKKYHKLSNKSDRL